VVDLLGHFQSVDKHFLTEALGSSNADHFFVFVICCSLPVANAQSKFSSLFVVYVPTFWFVDAAIFDFDFENSATSVTRSNLRFSSSISRSFVLGFITKVNFRHYLPKAPPLLELRLNIHNPTAVTGPTSRSSSWLPGASSSSEGVQADIVNIQSNTATASPFTISGQWVPASASSCHLLSSADRYSTSFFLISGYYYGFSMETLIFFFFCLTRGLRINLLSMDFFSRLWPSLPGQSASMLFYAM
jgi:hypothetical protein